MRGARALVAAVMLLAPLRAGAAELLLGWDGRGVWTSNIFRTDRNEEDAYSLYQGPDLGLRQRQGDLRYDIRYRPRYEAFLDLNDANAFEHYATASGTWDIDRRTQVTLDNRFSRSRGLRDVFEPTGPDPEEGEIFINRDAILRNSASGAASRWLSQRNQLVLNLNQQYYDYEDQDRPDATSTRGAASLRRMLTRRQTAGLGFAVTRQDNQGTTFQEARGTTFLESFLIYDLVISRTLNFSLSGGPTWVMPDDFENEQAQIQYATTTSAVGVNGQLLRFQALANRASCTSDLSSSCSVPAVVTDLTTGAPPSFPPPLSLPVVSVAYQDGVPTVDSSLTFFGSAVLSYRRSPYVWALSYTRRASNTSGLGTSTNLDVARATVSWEPARRWRLTTRATWQRQVSSSEVPIPGGVVNPDGVTLFLDANGRPVGDPDDARYSVANVAEVGAVRTVDFDDNAIDLTTYTVDLRASHALTRRLELRAEAAYWYQTSGGNEGEDSNRDSLRFELGFTWSFDPISL